MTTELIFVRHFHPLVDPKVEPSVWPLDNSIDHPGIDIGDIDLVYSSTEKKAKETAEIITKGKSEIIKDSSLDELKGPTEFIDIDDFKKYRKMQFSNFNYSENGSETPMEAIVRISSFYNKTMHFHRDKKILIVSHGTLLSLFFNIFLKLDRSTLFNQWEKLPLGATGIIMNNKVVKSLFEH